MRYFLPWKPVVRVGDSRNEIEISANNTIRMLTIGHAVSPVPRLDLPQPAVWQNVLSTYGGGGLLGSHAKRSLRLAGGETISLDGAWQYRIVLHPTNKQDVGRRLALAARHVIYGESISASGPIPLNAKRAAGEVTVEFGDIESRLVSYSHDSPIGFELCADVPGTCRFAEARIEGSRVRLSVPDGVSPTRVRYGWADSPVCTLFDLSGLPVGPSRCGSVRETAAGLP